MVNLKSARLILNTHEGLVNGLPQIAKQRHRGNPEKTYSIGRQLAGSGSENETFFSDRQKLLIHANLPRHS